MLTTITPYEAMLERKRSTSPDSGFVVDPDDLHEGLFDWQRRIVAWALRRGRSAVFADTGLGKTRMQVEWARNVSEFTDGAPVMIFAPLAVAHQTIAEAKRIGVTVTHCREARDVPASGIAITNYERLDRFTPGDFAGIVLDESSILKSYDGKTRKALNAFASTIPFRACFTATPAPNDLPELTTHAEFLGIMRRDEILALYFTQDGNSTQKWRLKGHGTQPFYRWMAEWCVAIRKPSDAGGDDSEFALPPLRIIQHEVASTLENEGQLFKPEAQTLSERREARRESLTDRANLAASIVNAEPDEPWLIWCDLNIEADALRQRIPDAVEVRGPDDPDLKTKRLLGFADGDPRILISKPSIAGHGMNYQHCARVLFVGLSDSFEQFYQAVRRCYRYGQKRPVEAHVITSDAEGAVVRNIQRKERQAATLMHEIVSVTTGIALGSSEREEMPHERDEAEGSGWRMLLGDSVEVTRDIPDETAGLILFSPPFPGMYVYTNSPRDMGNVASVAEMIEQYAFLAPELLRILKPGRSCAVHLTQGIAHKWRDGHSGRRDFRGKVIECMEDAGFVYYGEVTIDKDPQVKAIRTKDRGLLFKTLATDSSNMRMAMADYVLQFRKPGENTDPIPAGISDKYRNTHGWITAEEWIEWAAPVWYSAHRGLPGGIRETDVLNVSAAREAEDERHLCPLQLGVIERCVKLWTNPGEVVFSPFGGIGSEGVGALRYGREFLGIELKRSYWQQACRNLAEEGGKLRLEVPASDPV